MFPAFSPGCSPSSVLVGGLVCLRTNYRHLLVSGIEWKHWQQCNVLSLWHCIYFKIPFSKSWSFIVCAAGQREEGLRPCTVTSALSVCELPSVERPLLADLWMTFKSPNTPLSFPQMSFYSPQSLRCSRLGEVNKPARSSEEAQSGERRQRNNLHNTKAFVSGPLSGRWVVTVGITWIPFEKQRCQVQASHEKQGEALCFSTKHIMRDVVFHSILF